MNAVDTKSEQPLMLSERVYNGVGDILKELSAKTHANVIVFCEANGYPVLYKGNTTGMDLMAISSLAANNFSATAKMASMIGEADSFKFLFHEGEQTNIYLSRVGYNFLLLVIFDVEVALGFIRIYTSKAIQKLDQLLKTAKDEEDKSKEFIDLEFKTLLSEELNRALKI